MGGMKQPRSTYRSTIELPAQDYETLAAFRQALRRFLRFSEAAAEREGLTARQHQALLAIRGSRGARLAVGDLAERLQIRHHSAVGLVDRLVSLRFVVRGREADDRRRVLVALTASGERKLARLAIAHREELRGLAPRLAALLRSLGSGQVPRRRRKRSIASR